MEKRVLAAVALSVLVLVSWQFYVSKMYPVDNKRVNSGENQVISDTSEIVKTLPLANEISLTVPSVVDFALGSMESAKTRITLVNPGARISEVYLSDYKLNFAVNGGLWNQLYSDKEYIFTKSNQGSEVSFGQNGHFIYKRMSNVDDNYMSNLEIIYKNTTSDKWEFSDQLILGAIPVKINNVSSQYNEVVFLDPPNTTRKNPLQIKNKYVHKNSSGGLGLRSQYACIVVKNKEIVKGESYFVDRQSEFSFIGIDLPNIVVAPNSQISYKYAVYTGPQDVSILKKSGKGFEEVVHYGTFDFISSLLLSLLRFFYTVFRNWGIALIILSIAVYLILYPLTLKQMHAMKQMQILQPKIEALRKNYKDNPQRLNKEVLELYREHKANPLGGCLPMILQIPIFFGLYQALSRSIELKGASFLWIKDLAEGDRLWTFPAEVFFIGKDLNILPILMAVVMFFQQKITAKASVTVSSAAAEQQKIMTIIFPVMFGVIFYKAPSGLALYWFINSLLSVLAQGKLLKPASAVSMVK